MRPKKHPYSGAKKAKQTTKEEKLELVVFPNISLRKDWLKHIFSVVKQHDNTTIIYFRIPKVFGLDYEEQRAKVNLSYEETLKIINGV
jgi:hypothetical protein|nr:MAG TPA: hypothetical protein [Caudoviricetes sp.]